MIKTVICLFLVAIVFFNLFPLDEEYTAPTMEEPTEDQEFLGDDICLLEIDYCGGDGDEIELALNTSAVDPTYDQMIDFIKADRTDRNDYIPNEYVCADFAEDVQQNAEAAGYNCAWVSIDFIDGKTHACNAFNTTDRGLVFVDCTRSMGDGPTNQDCIVNVVDGEEYTQQFIKNSDYETIPMGVVESHEVIWRGDLW